MFVRPLLLLLLPPLPSPPQLLLLLMVMVMIQLLLPWPKFQLLPIMVSNPMVTPACLTPPSPPPPAAHTQGFFFLKLNPLDNEYAHPLVRHCAQQPSAIHTFQRSTFQRINVWHKSMQLCSRQPLICPRLLRLTYTMPLAGPDCHCGPQ